MKREEAYKIVLEDLKKCDLFIGKYDAKNGSIEFMEGISCVMENIAYEADDKEYIDLFTRNIIESRNKYGVE